MQTNDDGEPFPLYEHPKIDGPIKEVLDRYVWNTVEHPSTIDRMSWEIQHALHCQGITMSLHGEPVQ